MFYEIRRYRTQPGRRDDWVRYMEGTVIPFQTEQGMTVTASFVDEEDPDGYVWIRRFENEAERVALYAAVYESERWQQEIGPEVRQLLVVDEMKVTRVVPTAASGLR